MFIHKHHLTQETLRELQAFICNTENSKDASESTEENNKSHDAAEDPPSKRAKVELSETEARSEDAAAAAAPVNLKDRESSVCVVCLGILQELCGPTQAVKVCVLNIHCSHDEQ